MSKQLMTVLTSGTVVDRSVFVKSTSAELQAMLDNVLTVPRVLVVDDSEQFFTSKNMLALIEAGDDNYKLITENAGITIGNPEVTVIRTSVRLREEITKAMAPVLPSYDFNNVPNSWSVETDLNLDNKSVSRKRPNAYGDSVTYTMTLRQMEKLWTIAGNRWLNKSGPKITSLRRGSYDTHHSVIAEDYVQIGCQRVRRFELEQLALHMKWAFPERTVTA